MAYRFQPESTLEANVRRILGEQLDKARYQLTENFDYHPAEAIHDTRKRLKKSRSVLRLVRKALPKEDYHQEKNTLRDMGRLLGPARDGEAHRETLNHLKDYYTAILDEEAFSTLQDGLLTLHQAQLQQIIDHPEPLITVINTLKESHLRLKRLSLTKTGWQAVGKNLKRLYRQGQERLHNAYDQGNDACFHEWRKRVKDLMYDLRLLNGLWPLVMQGMETETHQLAKYLGDDHDIAELRQFLLSHQQDEPLRKSQLKLLLPLMQHRQGQLRQQARGLGNRLYAETPDAFIDRLKGYWQIWFQGGET